MSQITDFTNNGQCSHCGACCGSVIPVTEKELKALRKWSKKNNFHPELPPGDVVYLHCPFLNKKEGKCEAYVVRPEICRVFKCDEDTSKIMAAYAKTAGSEEPEPTNIWSIFNKTGLRIDGEEIPYVTAPFCSALDDKGRTIELHVGRPIELQRLLPDGSEERIPASIILNITREGIKIFHAGKQEIEDIPFTEITDILTKKAIK